MDSDVDRLRLPGIDGQVLILRAHYTMDVFTGIITALWVWSIAFALGGRLDAWLAGLAK